MIKVLRYIFPDRSSPGCSVRSNNSRDNVRVHKRRNYSKTHTMIKCVALISVLVALSQAQKPFYASSRQYPEVLPRFLDKETSTTSQTTVVDRLGESSSSGSSIPSTTTTTTTQFPDVVVPGAESDPEWVRRVATWPRDKQPFSFINRGAIQDHLHPATQTNVLRPEVTARSFFAGK